MAWRIEEILIRGEVDNRVRGRVTGRLWFTGRDAPVVLELAGNAWRDVAGHVLRFTNPEPKPARVGEWEHFPAVQRGVVGDITASRKVKVPDCSMDELLVYYKARKPFPWHWGNSLYLEWHSETNGRVLIESASYTLELDAEAAWTMDEAEEQAQREANGRAMVGFMERLGRAAALASEGAFVEEELLGDTAGDDDAPTSEGEAEADAEAARMDLLLDRVTARMEREGLDAEELERVMDEERERLRRERGESEPKPLTPEEEAERVEWIAEMNAAGEQALAESTADDWRDDEDREHRLVARCGALRERLHKETEARGWLSDEDAREHPLRELVNGVMIAGAKLAGALNTLDDEEEWPPEKLFAGSVLVRLKKARGHLRDALAGLDAADEQGLAETGWRAEVRAETRGILEEVERLIVEVRAVLEDGEEM